MGKLHKEIGHLIVQSAEDVERSDSQVIKVRTRSDVTLGTCPHDIKPQLCTLSQSTSTTGVFFVLLLTLGNIVFHMVML